MPKRKSENPQIAPRNRSNIPLDKTRPAFQQLIEKDLFAQPAQQIRHRYQNLLLKCLPEIWHHRVFFRSIESGHWHLLVATQTDAFKLRFLLPEISERLNIYLSNPARLKVHVHPDLWQILPQTRRTIKVKPARAFSTKEAEDVIQKFCQQKNNY